MLVWHRGALQLHARSLKVVTNLHEKEQTAVILTFYEEVQPTEPAPSATFALQVDDVSFATWIKTGWRVVGQVGIDFIPSIRTTGEVEELQASGKCLPPIQPSAKRCQRLRGHSCRLQCPDVLLPG